MSGIYILSFLIMGVGMLLQFVLRSKFKKYSTETLAGGLSGAEIAAKMLSDNGIRDVKIISVQGQLTDHYNPADKTVNLSEGVYEGRNAAAAAVAAHECGHAVQHAKAYSMLQLRSSLVPIVSVASSWMQWVLLAGILMINQFPQLLLIGIVMFAATTVFAFVTLPVEFDASRRALVWLESSRTTTMQEHSRAKDALFWAAMTYVAAALGSLATLAYYLMIYMGRSRD
ncbi:MAG: zinc metallopeptidase [Bacteroidetes bacterium]|nr:zinc metallopeptidase [Bacteroidota bacterium]